MDEAFGDVAIREVGRARAVVALHEALCEVETDLAGLLQRAADKTAQLLGDAGAIWVLDGSDIELRAVTHHDPDALALMERVSLDLRHDPRGLISSLVLAGTPRRLSGGQLDQLSALLAPGFREYLQAYGVSGLAVVPLISRGRHLGAIGVARDLGGLEYTDDDLGFLVQLSRVVALSMANAVLLDEVGAAQRRATTLSQEDDLTGLLNRRGFVEVLRERLHEGSHPSGMVAVLDMDGFKLVNDGFGHATGDVVLASMAARLCGALPASVPVARLGGDEFAIFVEADTEEHAAAQVEDAIAACTGTIQVVGLSVPMTVSVGTAVAADGEADQALLHAGLAMHRAKRRGAMVAAYDPRLDDPATRRLREVIALRRSIAGGELVVHYQPVVDVGDVPSRRVEALVRRRVDDRLLPPNGWLPMADKAGLMPELTASVLEQVIDQLALWWASGLEIECAVNVPATVLAAPDVVNELIGRLDDARLPRRALSVEVTESDLVGAQAKAALTRCAEADISVAVDDFGTGWSALSYLVDLPLRTLKIDRAFVDGVDTHPRRAAVVRAVVDVAHELGLQVIAEGVETSAVADVIIDLGADAIQGYYYCRPGAADAVESALRTGLVAAHS